MEKIKFNLNDYVSIKITEYGWKYLRETVGEDYIKHCIESRKNLIDGEDYYRLQGHVIMSIFGGAIFASYPTPILPECFIELDSVSPPSEASEQKLHPLVKWAQDEMQKQDQKDGVVFNGKPCRNGCNCIEVEMYHHGGGPLCKGGYQCLAENKENFNQPKSPSVVTQSEKGETAEDGIMIAFKMASCLEKHLGKNYYKIGHLHNAIQEAIQEYTSLQKAELIDSYFALKTQYGALEELLHKALNDAFVAGASKQSFKSFKKEWYENQSKS